MNDATWHNPDDLARLAECEAELAEYKESHLELYAKLNVMTAAFGEGQARLAEAVAVLEQIRAATQESTYFRAGALKLIDAFLRPADSEVPK